MPKPEGGLLWLVGGNMIQGPMENWFLLVSDDDNSYISIICWTSIAYGLAYAIIRLV
jgi:hypothetical protein